MSPPSRGSQQILLRDNKLRNQGQQWLELWVNQHNMSKNGKRELVIFASSG